MVKGDSLPSEILERQNVDFLVNPVGGDNNGEADGGLSGREGAGEGHEGLTRHIRFREVTGGGDEVEVGGVNHELHCEEKPNRIPLRDEAVDPDGEQDSGKDHVAAQRFQGRLATPGPPAWLESGPL